MTVPLVLFSIAEMTLSLVIKTLLWYSNEV